MSSVPPQGAGPSNGLGGLQLDLDSLARKVIHGFDRRGQTTPRQPVTRIAAQINGLVVTNKHRILNIISNGANVLADDVNGRSNIVIPCGYLYCVATGTPIVASTVAVTSIHIHDNLKVVRWTVIADQVGSITFDLKKSTYFAHPTTATIIVGTPPNLTTQQKNTALTPVLPALPWTNLLADDVLDIVITASTTVQRATLVLQCQATG
jgi:hypothetical protein